MTRMLSPGEGESGQLWQDPLAQEVFPLTWGTQELRVTPDRENKHEECPQHARSKKYELFNPYTFT